MLNTVKRNFIDENQITIYNMGTEPKTINTVDILEITNTDGKTSRITYGHTNKYTEVHMLWVNTLLTVYYTQFYT